jgi:hypothetical protein
MRTRIDKLAHLEERSAAAVRVSAARWLPTRRPHRVIRRLRDKRESFTFLHGRHVAPAHAALVARSVRRADATAMPERETI